MPDNCNLTANHLTKVLTGPATKKTTVQISNTSGGSAQFQTISYNGKEIAKNATSATFTIVAGEAPLSYVYEGSSAGDQILFSDPCGTHLDTFPSDPGNPTVERTVLGQGPVQAAPAQPGESGK